MRFGAALLLGTAVLGLGYGAIEIVPEWLGDTAGLNADQQADERGRVRTGVLSFLAGSIAVVGAVYTARTFALNRRGQVTERFTRAVDQLGNASLDVRLGGIYALDRLARDSRDDHGPIMEILMAYIREHAAWRPPATDGDAPAAQEDPPPTTVDVRAAVSVLMRRAASHDGQHDIDFDLAGTNLSGIDTERLRLRGARLTETQLFEATLLRADLEDATLVAANLAGAVLTGARLRSAQLRSACLRGANLQGCDLSGAGLNKTDLKDAVYDGKTRWPEGFDPEEAGAVEAVHAGASR